MWQRVSMLLRGCLMRLRSKRERRGREGMRLRKREGKEEARILGKEKNKFIRSFCVVLLLLSRRGLSLGNWSSSRGAYHWGKAFPVSFSLGQRSSLERDAYCANLSLADMKILIHHRTGCRTANRSYPSTPSAIPQTQAIASNTRESLVPNG
jgi:hypothetical protein